MKHYPQIIGDLLKIIARQERDIICKDKTINKNSVEIETLKSNLRESNRIINLLTEIMRKHMENGEKIADAVINLNQEIIGIVSNEIASKKLRNKGGNPYPPSNNPSNN